MSTSVNHGRLYKGICAVAAPSVFSSTADIAFASALYVARDFFERASWMQQCESMILDSGIPHCCVAVNVETASGSIVGSA
jgi:hypothetical protein